MEKDFSNLKITNGHSDEAEELSQLALRSKAHWPYDEIFIERCRADLTISKELASSDFLKVARLNNEIIGFYSFKLDDGPEMEHLFVDPPFIGKGIGKALWNHAVALAKENGWARFTLCADPYAAESFYIPMGCKQIDEIQSPVEKNRKLPVMEFTMVGLNKDELRVVERKNEPLDVILDFYKAQGYGGGAKEDDKIFLSYLGSELICVVRIAIESETPVLRGMYLKENLRGQGLGKIILTHIEPSLDKMDSPCFCIPKSNLNNFYGLIGFKKLEVEDAPIFLQDRINGYKEENYDVIMMKRGLNI